MSSDNPGIHTEDIALFSRPPVNVAEDRVSWHEIHPSYMSNAEYSSINFSIVGNSTQYVKLSDTELYVRIAIQKEDATPYKVLDDDNKPLPINKKETGTPIDFILHSMWSSVDIKMNNNLVSESGTNYMYKALMEALLTYDENTKKIQLSNEGFTGDLGNFTQINPDSPPYNHGLKVCHQWFKDFAVVEFVGPLMADICNQDRLILPGVDIDIKLWPTRDEFRLITHPLGLRCKLLIDEIYLNVCKVNVSPEVMMGHDAALEIADSIYPFARTDIQTFNIAEGNFGMNIEDIWQGEVPSKLVVALVKSQAYNGDYHLNPFHFEHFNVSDIGFFVNGEATPCPAYKLDLENGIYLQGLNSLYKITGKTMENSDIGITRETYQQGYTLIGFDVDPTTSPDFRYVGKPREGHTKLEIRFKNGLPSPVTAILYATFPEIMTIDQARNVRVEIKDKFAQRRERSR